jgi:hypothetical protein
LNNNDLNNNDSDNNDSDNNDLNNEPNESNKYNEPNESNESNESNNKKIGVNSFNKNQILSNNLIEEQKYILMGLSPKYIVDKIMNLFSKLLKQYKPLGYNKELLIDFIKKTFGDNFIIPNDPVLTQRISIYTQLYLNGGLFINPVNIQIKNIQFEKMFNIDNKNVFFILKSLKSKRQCENSINIHSIRKGIPEREVQVNSYFIYSKVKNHNIFLDILELINKRYSESVPQNEYIESLTKYGREYLIGSDIINEVIYQNSKIYKDVVILKKESYLKYLKILN